MTTEQLRKGEELSMKIYNLEKELIILKTDSETFKINQNNFYVSIGHSCGIGVKIGNHVSVDAIYNIAINGMTKQIKELKKEFKSL